MIFFKFEEVDLSQGKGFALEKFIKATKESVDSPVITTARYVVENYHQEISLGNLADVCGKSPYQLIRVFQRKLKLSPIRFVWLFRITLAAELIRTKPYLIREIALAVGFTTTSHFAWYFKNQFGVTPSSYRLRFGLKRAKARPHGAIVKPHERLLLATLVKVVKNQKS